MVFKPNESSEDIAYEYEVCYVDFDTVLFRSAKMLQEDYIVVTNKRGKKKEFKNVTAFYGRGKARDGGWIGEQNKERLEKGLPPISADDYTIETAARVKESPDPEMTIIEYGLSQIDYKVGDIKKASKAKAYVLGIGSLEPNFRYEVAHILPYKGARKPKPILFLELREAFIQKYRNKVLVAKDGLEMDDEISIKGWESYKHFLKTGKHKYVIAFVDKDLRMTPCPSFNYDKVEEGITTPSIEDCARAFAAQILSGDLSTDNIQGLPNLNPDFCTKYGLAKPRGVGKATALQILEDCETPKEMYERVVEAYRTYYGEDEFEFTSHRGQVSKRTWLDMLKENAVLLYMLRNYNEAGTYDITNTFNKLGVTYG
jgi:hypothetical protein